MSDNTQQQQVKKSKKDIKVLEQWADTKDPFVNQLYKKLRNVQKKLNRIKEVDTKIRKKEIQPNAEQLEMVSRKDKVQEEMDEILSYLNLYKESFPDNPAFTTGKKAAATEEKPVESAPAVDLSTVIENALALVADTVIFGTLNGEQQVELKGSTQNLNNAIQHVLQAWNGLTEGAGTWSQAKGAFVETFSRLVSKSATQIGTHTGHSFSDLHTFIATFSDSEGQTILSLERIESLPAEQPVVVTTSAEATETHADAVAVEEEEKGEAVDGTSPGELKEGGEDAGLLGEESKGERGGYRGRGNRGRGGRGQYFRKHRQDEEGFEVVRETGEAHQNHFPSRRQRGGFRGAENHRGGFRGGEFRGGEHRGGEHRGGEHRGEHRGGERGFSGGRGRGGDRPYTEHKPREHRGRGDVRTVDPQPVVEQVQPTAPQ